MAFPSRDTASNIINSVQTFVSRLKSYATDAVTMMGAGPVSANLILEIYVKMVEAAARLDAMAAFPGISVLAKQDFGDNALDIVAEINSLKTQCTNVSTQISATLPTGAGGYLLLQTLTPTGIAVRQVTSAQSASLRTALTNLAASIS